MKNVSLFNIIKLTFGIVIFGIIAVILIPTEHLCKKELLLSNAMIIAIIAILLIFFALLCFLYRKKQSVLSKLKVTPNFDKIVIVATAFLFLWQCYSAYNIFFLTGWDAEIVMTAAQNISDGNFFYFADYFGNYYSTYPNNLFITYSYAVILKISKAVGIFGGKYIMMNIVIINCLINSFSCFLIYKASALLTEKKMAFLGYCFGVLSVGFSSWNVICYSDSFALFIPLLSLYLYIYPFKNKYIKIMFRLSAVAVSTVGYFIKPQCAIPLIAVIAIEFASIFNNFRFKKILKPIALCMMVLLIFCGVNLILNVGNQKTTLKIDENKTFGVSHFLMMGFNEEYQGTYCDDDVLFSRAFKTTQERTSANLIELKHRVKNMGVSGLLKHINRKLHITFNDGTFDWGGRVGSFYLYIPENTNSKISPALRSICYNISGSYLYLASIQQFVWIAVLLFSFMSVFALGNSGFERSIAFFWLAILGITFYELLFEVRARYVYIFAPIFCVLAAVGIGNTIKLIFSHVKKIRLFQKVFVNNCGEI